VLEKVRALLVNQTVVFFASVSREHGNRLRG